MSKQIPLLLTLCLEENTILVSTAILDCLGNPRLIQMMINDEMRSLIIRPCKDGDRESILIPDTPMYQFEYPGQALLRRIRRLTKWQNKNPRAIYGTFVPQINAVVFDLMSAQIAILQTVPDVFPDASDAPDSSIARAQDDTTDSTTLSPGIYGIEAPNNPVFSGSSSGESPRYDFEPPLTCNTDRNHDDNE